MEENLNLYTCTCGAQYVAEEELEECTHVNPEPGVPDDQ